MLQTELPDLKISGGTPIAATAPFTVVARLPEDAKAPAYLVVRNTHATAIIYLKWIPINQTRQSFPITDAAIKLSPGESFTWDNPPRSAMLLAQSTVADALLAADGSWVTPSGAVTL